jgi:branched-subunit amino acid aminotransferase/4-amino-4-deoxychorismate lyase
LGDFLDQSKNNLAGEQKRSRKYPASKSKPKGIRDTAAFGLLSMRNLEPMSVTGDFYQFRDGEFHHVDDTLSETLTVADSFLVENGRVREIGRHFKRFSGSIGDQAPSAELDNFFNAVVEQLPRSGAWFPRLEFRADLPTNQQLVLRIREAPERTESVTLWSSDEPDPRKAPQIKGPDLSACQRLRRAANLRGADEAVILDPDGCISDGALSSIMWWRDGVLCAPDGQTQWLPSITRELAFELAKAAGYETCETKAKPADLAGCEIWSLSSLQGIRHVTSWDGLEIGMPAHASSFRKRLALLGSELSQIKSAIA